MARKEIEKEDGLKLLFQSIEKPSAPEGLDDRIMRAVEAEHVQQKAVRRNLRLALGGVAVSIFLAASLVFGADVVVEDFLERFSLEGKGISNLVSIAFIFISMLFLFVEMELVVKYWLHKHFARPAR